MADEELNLEEETEETEEETEEEEEEEETEPTPVMDFYVTQNRDKRFTFGMHDAVTDNGIMRDVPSRLAYVRSEDDLDLLTDEKPGTIAAQYGFKHMWQLDDDGTWQPMDEAEEETTASDDT